MRLMLIHDDGDLLSTWSIPNHLAPADVDAVLSEGMHRHHQLDRCDRCGGFFARTSMVEVPDDRGPTVTCQPCAQLPY